MVLCFSGTGNSLYAAKIIARITGDELISLNDRIKNGSFEDINSEKPLVFVAPTYAWNLPRIVRDYILKTRFTGSSKAYFVLTCGSGTGSAAYGLLNLCREKQFEFMGLATIIMPENYVAMFPVPDEPKSKKIISKAIPKIKHAAELILNGDTLNTSYSPVLGLLCNAIVTSTFYKLFVKDKGFYTTGACTGCGRCVSLCPTNNIRLNNARPVWEGKCTHCMACICSCPTEAIEYKNKSKGKRRYLLTEEPY